MVYATEKTLKELGDKVNAGEKQKIEDAVAALKQALTGDNVEDIKAKTEALKQASYKIAEEVYKQQAAAQGAQGADQGGADGAAGSADSSSAGSGNSNGGAASGKADDVDYEVVDDDK